MTTRILTSPAITEPVTLTEAKSHLQVDLTFTEDDAKITRLITVAREHVERRTRKLMAVANVEMYFDDFPCEVDFPWYPVNGLVSIAYKDASGDQQSIEIAGNGDLILKKFNLPAKLILLNMPDTYKSVSRYSVENVVITFSAGYGSEIWPLPQYLKQAMLVCIRDMYDNPESMDAKKLYTMPMAAENIIANETIYQFF